MLCLIMAWNELMAVLQQQIGMLLATSELQKTCRFPAPVTEQCSPGFVVKSGVLVFLER
jgi:hypothetical protein